ncbi:hypothetical protein HYPSUDRAFT_38393 [Hypholoma sublateritium FD-334 SS-4]|uniref:DUF6534 domain-containing protein n=1 Tax=Hypholoma sublateritium (strain FD-334 SS-4) TaxID=945553 RepID=A0A0D2P7U8_HYPSF|nr:hypothetical protein HYPSUDRAFT_38393 [Hypholoma sublateritium FD-334 SS-4]
MTTEIPPLPFTLPFNFAAIVGPELLGGCLSWGLYGIFSTQVYMYLQAFTEDARMIKALVFAVFVAMTVQIIMYTDTLWQVYAAGFGNLAPFDLVGLSWFSVIVIEGIVAFTVQSFYAWRISIISTKKLPSVLIMATALVSIVSAMISAAHSELVESKLNSRSIDLEANLWQACSAVCDVLIAVCMTYYLKRRAPDRSELGASNTVHSVVNKIIRVTIETGSFTAAVNIVTLALNIFSHFSHVTYFQCAVSTLTGIYATTFMVVLNSRIKFSVSSLSTTWKDTESGRLTPLGNIMHRDNSSSVLDNRREGKVNAIMVEGSDSASRSDDMEFSATKEV